MQTNPPVNHQELQRMRMIGLAVIIAFLCQLVGFIGPGWMVLSSEFVTLKTGFWFALVCVGENGCETVSMTLDSQTVDVGSYVWLGYQVLTTVGVVACLITVGYIGFFQIGHRTNPGNWYTIVAVLMFFAGGCAIAPVLLVGKSLINTAYDFPWALFFTGVGGVISIVTMIITLTLGYQTNTERRQIQPNSAVAMKNTGDFPIPGYSTPVTECL